MFEVCSFESNVQLSSKIQPIFRPKGMQNAAVNRQPGFRSGTCREGNVDDDFKPIEKITNFLLDYTSPAPGRSCLVFGKCRNEKVVSCFPTLYNHFQEQPNYFYSLLWITLMIKKTRGQSKVPSSRSIHSKSTIWRDFGGISSEFQLDAVL